MFDIRFHGRGGQGAVYLAEDARLRRALQNRPPDPVRAAPQRFSTLGTGFGRSRNASGMPEPSSGRR